ncbi:MAG: arylesterase [Acidobacteriota bacterium]
MRTSNLKWVLLAWVSRGLVWTAFAVPSVAEDKQDAKLILFLGDSLTAGYGIDPAQAFPALIQQKIDRKGWPFEVLNAGLSGETSAGGLRRISWMLQRNPGVLVLELGANDGLRGFPLELTKRNLQGIISRARGRLPDLPIVLAGMMVPPNLGPEYTQRFQALYKELALDNGLSLIPFLLEGVAGQPELNLADGIHPTPQGHQIIAETVWKTLEPVLESLLKNGDAQEKAGQQAGSRN